MPLDLSPLKAFLCSVSFLLSFFLESTFYVMIFMVNSILVTEVIGCWTQKKNKLALYFQQRARLEVSLLTSDGHSLKLQNGKGWKHLEFKTYARFLVYSRLKILTVRIKHYTWLSLCIFCWWKVSLSKVPEHSGMMKAAKLQACVQMPCWTRIFLLVFLLDM